MPGFLSLILPHDRKTGTWSLFPKEKVVVFLVNAAVIVIVVVPIIL
jgi:hypothetical protein